MDKLSSALDCDSNRENLNEIGHAGIDLCVQDIELH